MAAEGPIQQVGNVLKTLEPLFAQAVDIHNFTRKIGQDCRSVMPLENDYGLVQETNLDAVITEILAFSGNDPAVARVLASIRTPAATNEPETGLNIQTLLKSTWAMSKTAFYANAQEVVIENLKHNIDAKGGCLAGISARLVLPYLVFLKNNLETKLDAAFAFEQPAQRNEVDDIALAIEESLSYSPPQMQEDEDFEEDLELAIAYSLGSSGVRFQYSAKPSFAPSITIAYQPVVLDDAVRSALMNNPAGKQPAFSTFLNGLTETSIKLLNQFSEKDACHLGKILTAPVRGQRTYSALTNETNFNSFVRQYISNNKIELVDKTVSFQNTNLRS